MYVPRRGGGGGEKAPGTHCLRMRVIIGWFLPRNDLETSTRASPL